jgi:hypothetical protein
LAESSGDNVRRRCKNTNENKDERRDFKRLDNIWLNENTAALFLANNLLMKDAS